MQSGGCVIVNKGKKMRAFASSHLAGVMWGYCTWCPGAPGSTWGSQTRKPDGTAVKEAPVYWLEEKNTHAHTSLKIKTKKKEETPTGGVFPHVFWGPKSTTSTEMCWRKCFPFPHFLQRVSVSTPCKHPASFGLFANNIYIYLPVPE